MSITTKVRIEIEKRIAKKLVADLLAAGFVLSVSIEAINSIDPEDHEIWRSKDEAAIVQAMFAGDEDWIKVYYADNNPEDEDLPMGWVRLVYGNDGWDVISDYTTNLEKYMQGASALADAIEKNPIAALTAA